MNEPNNVLDIRINQRDRDQTTKGYKFKTFDEMAIESVAKRWLIKGIFARRRIFRVDRASWRHEICAYGKCGNQR
jgi:hypothetical protein